MREMDHRRSFIYYASGIVPANSSTTVQVNITAEAAFHCQCFTGSFTTLGAGGADDGVNHLSCKLSDSGRSITLFSDFIPLSLFLSPGRRRTSAVAGDAGNQLFFPVEFDYTFAPVSTIVLDLKNDSATDNTFEWAFLGEKLFVDVIN